MPADMLPDAEALAEMLANLFGIDVKVLPTLSMAGGTATISVDYVGPDKAVCVSIVADLAAVASLGAAMTGIAPETAEEAVSTRTLSDALVENYAEICNTLSTLLKVGEGSVEIKTVEGPLRVRPHRKTNAGGRAMSVVVAGYPKGALVFH